MADRLQIYNAALRLLGQQRLSALTESSATRRALDDAWRTTGDFLLAKGMWNFAIRAMELTADGDVTPLFGYDYAFRKPDDWVRTVSICDTADFKPGFEDFEDETNYWHASRNPLYVRFVSNRDNYGWNVGAWREPFAKAFSAYLAFECGLPITNDKSNRNDLHAVFEARLKEAKSLDAVDERVRFKPKRGELVRARFAYRSNDRRQ